MALITALIVLLAMTLAGLAVVRSTLTSTRVAGNLAFQQAATQSADVGIETAITWLQNNNTGARLHNHIDINAAEPVGYFAQREDPAANQSWQAFWDNVIATTARVNTLPVDGAGNSVSWVVHRLCNAIGDPVGGAGCEATPLLGGGEAGSRGAGVVRLQTAAQRYYRITARVDGPRNTVSFVQVVVAL
ncbi:MAG: PilX N-terminal domain-containing pilus assembly protein [Rubrivivax sp.]